MLNLDLLVLYSVTNRSLFIRVICYLKQTVLREILFIMLPGVSGKAAVLCVTSALTSTAAMGMMISTYGPWTLSLPLCVVTFTSNGSLAGCPAFHPTLAYSAAVNVQRMGMMKCIHLHCITFQCICTIHM